MSALAEALLAAQRVATLERERRDDVREAAAERAYWQDAGLEHAERVTLETWRWSR